LGRDELQLLSLVEEARAVQARLEKSNSEAKSMYQLLKSGSTLLLHAVEATPGRWNASIKNELTGFVVDWALDGEGLCRGDRILEVNGKVLVGSGREELQKLIGMAGKCELVVLRKHSTTFANQQLQQSQADNLRLQHRISYLEEQVRELQEMTKYGEKERRHTNAQNGAHVTSISISSPPSTPPEQHKPQIFQRGTYVTAVVGGKAVDPLPQSELRSASSVQNITKTLIKDSYKSDTESYNVLKNNMKNAKSISTSTISINSDTTMMQKKERDREVRRMEREKYIQQHSNMGKVHRSEDNGRLYHKHLHNGNAARSVEHLNSMDRRRISCLHNELAKRSGIDARSVKSLDFESDNGERNVDYTSEPMVVRAGRPTPPKKPIRLSLHRAQSLQTVDGSAMSDYEKKRTLKRAHKTDKANLAMKYIENSLIPGHTASLGRQKFIEKLINI
jgi:sulfur dioxygenase